MKIRADLNSSDFLFPQQGFVHETHDKYTPPTEAHILQKLDRWQDLKFSVLFHWGLYSVPGILIVNRTVKGKYENYQTPERSIPDTQVPFPWENCVALSNDWDWIPNAPYKEERVADLLSRMTAKEKIGQLCSPLGWEMYEKKRKRDYGFRRFCEIDGRHATRNFLGDVARRSLDKENDSHRIESPAIGTTVFSTSLTGTGIYRMEEAIGMETGIQALMRSDSNEILQSWSHDNGKSWSRITSTHIRNPNSGIDAVELKDGSKLLVYNPAEKGKEWWNGRIPHAYHPASPNKLSSNYSTFI